MLYTGSIWIPILLHGLSDSPMQFEGAVHYTKVVTGNPDWVGTIGRAFIYVAIGWVVIKLHKDQKMQVPFEWAKKLKLVEPEESNPTQGQ